MAVYTVIIHRLQKYILICTPPTVLRKKLLFTLQKVSSWNAKSSFSWCEKLLFGNIIFHKFIHKKVRPGTLFIGKRGGV